MELVRRARERSRNSEQILARFVHHGERCLLVKHRALDFPERLCDCGALGDRMRQTWIDGHNIVTDAGDIYYAQVAARFANGSAPAPTNNFNTLYAASTGSAPGKASTITSLGTFVTSASQIVDTGYPIANDSDTNNSGRAVDTLTWRFSVGLSGQVGTISDIGIGKAGETQSNGAPLLNHADEATFPGATTVVKTGFDTLTWWLNHNFLGI